MVCFDSNVLIYFLERNPNFFHAASTVMKPVLSDGEQACISIVAVTEILAAGGKEDSLAILDHRNITVVPADPEIAYRAGLLRQKYKKLKTPDALYLATALHTNASVFYTNDLELVKIGAINGMKITPLA